MPYAQRAFAPPFYYNNTTGYMVFVSNLPVMVLAGTLQFTLSVGKRGQAQFTTYTSTAVHFQQYQPVTIMDKNNIIVFTGYVTVPKEQKPGFQSSILTTVTCVDQHYLADKRCVAASYTNMSCGAIVYNIYNNILASEGVTIGNIYDGLLPATTLFPNTTLFPGGNVANIPQATFVYCTVSDALDALVTAASQSGVLYYWMIDQNKALYFVPYTTTAGPPIDGTTLEQINNPTTVQRSNPVYRNTQYVLGGTAQTVSQTETRIGDSNTRAWAMGFALANVPTITVGGVPQSVGMKGAAAGSSAFYWAQGDPVITQDSAQAVLTSSNTLHVVYIGQYPSIVGAANNAQVAYQASVDGTSGIVESVQTDNTLTSISNGLSEASQLLTRYAQQGILLTTTTMSTGFAPGQLITVNLPMHGINNVSMLVESVLASDQTDNYNIWYTITAISGPVDVTWQQFFSRAFKQQAPPNSINIGVTQSLQLLANFTTNFSVAMSFTSAVFACPIPNTTLLPNTTLFPC